MTSPWPATAARPPRESTCRSTRVVVVAVPLCCQRAAAARRAPTARRDRTVAVRTRAHAHAPPDRRCARPVRRRSLKPALVHWPPSPYSSQSRSPSASPGPHPSQVPAARLPRLGSRARRGASGCRGSSTSPLSSAHGHTYGPAGARREGGQLEEGLTNVSTVLIPNFWASHCLARVRKVGARCRPPARPETRPLCGERISCSTSAGALALSSRFRSRQLN